jgi:ribosomal protein S18 acetylase RimI-like enzyme
LLNICQEQKLNDVTRLAAALRQNDFFIAVPAAAYTFEELAQIYNESRVDYIVPMPMNARRMEEYVRHYDVSLEASVVALTKDGETAGIGMLGLRGDRAWVTRLGVIPNGRGRHLGLFISETLLEQAVARGVRHTQLEVILGNEPAHRLFLKLGFEDTRELLVLRRPPGAPEEGSLSALAGAQVEPLSDEELVACLNTREDTPSWIEENESLLKVGGLAGLRVTLPPNNGSGAPMGWIVVTKTAFQMTHFVLGGSPRAALPLLLAIHRQFPRHDTKLENLPVDSPLWPAFQQAGYLETFRRTEMYKKYISR